MKFKVYNDPGHGWVAVKRALLSELRLLDRISAYSYQKGETVYLEEDCDASVFVSEYKSRYGEMPEFTEKHTNGRSCIRNYNSFVKMGE